MSDSTPTPRPTLRLKPKVDAKRIRHGHPWVYLDDIVADRRSRAIAPGSLAVLEDADRVPLATVGVNMGSPRGCCRWTLTPPSMAHGSRPDYRLPWRIEIG